MRNSIFFTQQAEQALVNIQYHRVKKYGLSQARRQRNAFKDSLNILADNSSVRYSVDDVMPGIRYWACKPYAIFYILDSSSKSALILDIVLQHDVSEIDIE